MKRIIKIICALLALVITVPGFSTFAATVSDPIPENIGTVYNNATTGIKISYTRLFEDESGKIPVSSGLGAHGGHETRIVRTANGTYAAFITDGTGEPTDEHPGWDCGVATFSIIKITADGFERIFTAEYPQALGSCTPNLVQGENGIVYCTIIADDKDRRSIQHEYCNGVWLQVYKLDTATDTVTLPGGTQKFRHTTSPTDDHGYGYSQPIFDFKNGKMYALTCGGEAPGFLAWWIYDLRTDRWNSTCHTVQLQTRRCYINGYADGAGGFTVVIERCAPVKTIADYLGVQFKQTRGYMWDGLYVMHVANPNVNSFTDTVVREAVYTAEGYDNSGKNNTDAVSHYGNSGCTYLDTQNRLHVIYSHKNGNTKKTSVYHAVYDLSGNELFHELIPTSLIAKNGQALSLSVSSFAMTQDADGTYYIFCETNSSGAAVRIWTSPASDGLNFTQKVAATKFKDASGGTFSTGKFIIGNSRCYSDRDGYVPLMFEGNDEYYYTCIALPCAGSAQTHTHTASAAVEENRVEPTCTAAGSYDLVVYCSGCGEQMSRTHKTIPVLGHSYSAVTTAPTCTERGFTAHVCVRCGNRYVDSYVDAPGHSWNGGVVTKEPTYTEEGEITYTCTVCGETRIDLVDKKTLVVGDVNGDGLLTIQDLSHIKQILSGYYDEYDAEAADVNRDGLLTLTDIAEIKILLA